MKKLFVSFVLLLAANAQAQFGDAAILAELLAQTEQLIENVQAAKDTLDISQQLEQLETVKTIRALHEDGRALVDLAREAERLRESIDDFADDPLSTEQIQSDIDWLQRALERAEDDPNAASAYGSILMQLNKIDFLSKAQKASQERLANGANEEDKTQITATNSMIMSDLLISNERRVLDKETTDTSIVESVLSGISYAPLNKEDK